MFCYYLLYALYNGKFLWDPKIFLANIAGPRKLPLDMLPVIISGFKIASFSTW